MDVHRRRRRKRRRMKRDFRERQMGVRTGPLRLELG